MSAAHPPRGASVPPASRSAMRIERRGRAAPGREERVSPVSSSRPSRRRNSSTARRRISTTDDESVGPRRVVDAVAVDGSAINRRRRPSDVVLSAVGGR